MRAFVKTVNGVFSDVNYYLAWKGFCEMGYKVTLMDDIEKADYTVDTPIFAGTKTFDQIMVKLGVDYKRLDTYPNDLSQLLGRNITQMTFKEAKAIFTANEKPLFVKPLIAKQFQGNLWKSFLDLIPLTNIPDDAKVFISDPMSFISEFRCYINDGEIIAVKHYEGCWEKTIQKATIKETIKIFKSAPIAYALDFGLTKEKLGNGSIYCDRLVEANDGTSLGNYGLDSIHYAEMLVARWFEIVEKDRLEKRMAASEEEMDAFMKKAEEMTKLSDQKENI